MAEATVAVAGSDLVATLPFDVWISRDGTRYYLAGSIYPVTTDGNGDPLAERVGTLQLSLQGVTWLKLVAHAAPETVTASVFG